MKYSNKEYIELLLLREAKEELYYAKGDIKDYHFQKAFRAYVDFCKSYLMPSDKAVALSSARDLIEEGKELYELYQR